MDEFHSRTKGAKLLLSSLQSFTVCSKCKVFGHLIICSESVMNLVQYKSKGCEQIEQSSDIVNHSNSLCSFHQRINLVVQFPAEHFLVFKFFVLKPRKSLFVNIQYPERLVVFKSLHQICGYPVIFILSRILQAL